MLRVDAKATYYWWAWGICALSPAYLALMSLVIPVAWRDSMVWVPMAIGMVIALIGGRGALAKAQWTILTMVTLAIVYVSLILMALLLMAMGIGEFPVPSNTPPTERS